MALQADVDTAWKIALAVNELVDNKNKQRAVCANWSLRKAAESPDIESYLYSWLLARDFSRDEEKEFYEVIRELGYDRTAEEDSGEFINGIILEGMLAGLFEVSGVNEDKHQY